MAGEEEPRCPVDPSARSKWLSKMSLWRQEEQPSKKLEVESDLGVEKCPVDHTARQEWMKKMGGSGNPHVTRDAPIAIEESCSSDKLPEVPISTSNVPLPDEREISSIPRTGADSNWIYPSQKQFFELMQRKSWNPEAQDMKSVVPIHNAVNERAWSLIQMWERGQGGDQCGGIQLTSFKGDSKKLTPRARWKLFMGYEKPFDRHDWIINRCGKEIEYVIDFYSGKSNPQNPQAASFFLDVRPKLNSFEGVRMRLFKALGL